MAGYSFKKNLVYMAMAYGCPARVIDQLIHETSPLYSIFPFLLYLIIGEAGNYFAASQGVSPVSSSNPFPALWPIPDSDYYYSKLILFPVLSLLALALFAAVVYEFSRLPRFQAISAKRCTLFLMFLSTIGIAILLCESPWLPYVVRFYAPPIGGLISIIYVGEFIHKQASLDRASSFMISLVSLAVYFVFRGLTMR